MTVLQHPFTRLPFYLILVCALSSCLTAEHKEVRLSLNPDGKSGSGSILFTNIASSQADSSDVSKEDFNSLVVEYYQGTKIENENKGMKNVKKKLYKANGQLMGQINFDFDDVSTLGIVRYKDGPYMYYTVADGFFTSGTYENSNGSYLGEKMPVIFWDTKATDLNFTMALSSPQEPRNSILPFFDNWKASQH